MEAVQCECSVFLCPQVCSAIHNQDFTLVEDYTTSLRALLYLKVSHAAIASRAALWTVWHTSPSPPLSLPSPSPLSSLPLPSLFPPPPLPSPLPCLSPSHRL